MKSLLAQQMEKFDGLEHKFDMLLRHLKPPIFPQQDTQPPQRKRKLDKTLYKNREGCRIQISDAGTPTPTSDPPDPGINRTQPNDSAIQMDTDTKTLEGGIQDDDLSEQMLQEWDDSNSQTTDMSDSPEAARKKND